MSRLLAGDQSPRHEARPLLSSPAPNLRKPVLALALSGATLLVPLALSGSSGAPGAPGAEVVLAAGSPDGYEVEATGDDGELHGTLVDAGVAAQPESSAVRVKVQPAEVPEPTSSARPAAGTATTARPRLLTARAATMSTTTSFPSDAQPTATTAKKAPAAAAAATTTAAPTRLTTTTTRPPAARVAAPAPSSSDAVWDRLAQCESGNTNDHDAPYYGYWQVSEATWLGLGQVGLPDDHSREQQLVVAKRLQAMSGWSPWPACSRLLGLL